MTRFILVPTGIFAHLYYYFFLLYDDFSLIKLFCLRIRKPDQEQYEMADFIYFCMPSLLMANSQLHQKRKQPVNKSVNQRDRFKLLTHFFKRVILNAGIIILISPVNISISSVPVLWSQHTLSLQGALFSVLPTETKVKF